ncbi:MAG TPA: hypothetical protein DCM28_00020 [Phycisphaerales bacterium]|nr:hypothetical protein [Phycisphaerales bacterium]HCD34617.1 hypothetical protein [Phycisphaerales bacterium]|tara:strand:+ start:308 stop:862 length:555 start_codon:yes stop_codon:yes gene_type:complete
MNDQQNKPSPQTDSEDTPCFAVSGKTDTGNTQPDNTHMSHVHRPHYSRRRTWLKVMLLLVIFISGMVVGSGLTVYGIVRHMRSQQADPQARAVNWTHRLAKRLDLTPEQTELLLPVMTQSSERFAKIHREVRQQIDTELDRMQNEVTTVLPEEKVDTWQKQFNQMRNRWLPNSSVREHFDTQPD